MYIRLIDRHNFVSPILYIHSDEEEFMVEIKRWKVDILEWVERNGDGMPLGRLDAGSCMIDLLRHLTEYYLNTTPNCDGKVMGCLKLHEWPVSEDGILHNEEVISIKTYK